MPSAHLAAVSIVFGPVAATSTRGRSTWSDGSMSSSRAIDTGVPSRSTTSLPRNPWSRRRYCSNSATRIGFWRSTLTAPSPRPRQKRALPFEIPWSVAIAPAASSGWRSGTATAVPSFSVVGRSRSDGERRVRVREQAVRLADGETVPAVVLELAREPSDLRDRNRSRAHPPELGHRARTVQALTPGAP